MDHVGIIRTEDLLLDSPVPLEQIEGSTFLTLLEQVGRGHPVVGRREELVPAAHALQPLLRDFDHGIELAVRERGPVRTAT